VPHSVFASFTDPKRFGVAAVHPAPAAFTLRAMLASSFSMRRAAPCDSPADDEHRFSK